jgi:DNA-binding CsgD family transcriptional regulator
VKAKMHLETNQFSEREKEVMNLLLQGKSNKQIALMLGISASTVEYHLKNVYKKLHVSSRIEAVLQLGKSIGNEVLGELGKSIVEINGNPSDNGKKSISSQRIPMNKMFYIIGGGLLTTILVIVLVLANAAAQNNVPAQNVEVLRTPQANITPMAVTPSIISSSTPFGAEQSPEAWQEVAYTNKLDSFDVTLTLKWFYIDSSRVSMEFLVSGFPIPDGYAPIRIIKEFSLRTSNGNSIDPYYDSIGGEGTNGSESGINVAKNAINEVLSFPIKSTERIDLREESYIFDVTVGGVPIYNQERDIAGEILPATTFHFEVRPTHVGPLTFVTERAANIGEKIVTLKGVEINPTFSIITLCVFSPDTQQWIPNVALLYKENVFNSSGFALTNGKNGLSEELCYRLEYTFQFDVTDDPKQSIAIWVNKLTKDQPERLSNEVISSAFQRLSAKGVEFRYVVGDHGASIEVMKKPAELTEAEARAMIQKALTEEALTSGVLIFDLK